ncbi:MAG: hypothetical protein HGB17_17220 [Syntrophobacteraceae bacterium]|nr:hypothetical protein [Syntrophobacteraceae bacterium]
MTGADGSFGPKDRSALEFVSAMERDILEETATEEELKTLVNLLLTIIRNDIHRAGRSLDEHTQDASVQTSIRRAAHW